VVWICAAPSPVGSRLIVKIFSPSSTAPLVFLSKNPVTICVLLS
jgi:hypothetical protein